MNLSGSSRAISGKVATRSGATFGVFGGPPCGVRESDSVVWAQSQVVIAGILCPAAGPRWVCRSEATSGPLGPSGAMPWPESGGPGPHWDGRSRLSRALSGRRPWSGSRFSPLAGRPGRSRRVVRDSLQGSRASSGFSQRTMTMAMAPCPAGSGWSLGAKRRWVSGAGVKLVTRCWAGWRVGSDRRAWKGRSARCGRPCGRGDRGWPRRWSGR